MDPRTLTVAVAAALCGFGHPEPAKAPAPTAAGSARLLALAPKPHSSNRQAAATAAGFHCLALNIYHEARGEQPEGQLAVAYVTLNRVAQSGFPDTICGVVHQRGETGACQFGWTCGRGDHSPRDHEAWQAARNAARRALAGSPDPTHGALYFQRAGHGWAAHPVGRVVIGHHEFFRRARTGNRSL